MPETAKNLVWENRLTYPKKYPNVTKKKKNLNVYGVPLVLLLNILGEVTIVSTSGVLEMVSREGLAIAPRWWCQ